ncbi:sensor histidine kinase [Aliihoeflea sp. PC F10.4]
MSFETADMIDEERVLATALKNAGVAVIAQDRNLSVLWVQNLPSSWQGGAAVGSSDADFLPQAEAEKSIAIKRQVLSSERSDHYEMRHGSDDGGRWFSVWIDVRRDRDGTVQGVLSTIVDITNQKHREQTLRTLLREVSHRSKNLLAIIQSIATQTGRYSGSIEVFLARFRGRIQSLASSQDLVTSSNWRGAMLSELVAGQVSRYCEDPAFSIRLKGVDPYLNPNAALHIGLALHELVINSMSHGALSRPNGYVNLSASLEETEPGKRVVVLNWQENTRVADSDIGDRRFGSIALERVVPASVEGEASLSLANGYLDYRLSIPESNFEL